MHPGVAARPPEKYRKCSPGRAIYTGALPEFGHAAITLKRHERAA